MLNSEYPFQVSNEALAKLRAETAFSYICALLSLGKSKGMSIEEIADWVGEQYENWGITADTMNAQELVEHFVRGRSMIYKEVKVIQEERRTLVESKRWYKEPLFSSMLIFEISPEEFEIFGKRLFVKFAETHSDIFKFMDEDSSYEKVEFSHD